MDSDRPEDQAKRPSWQSSDAEQQIDADAYHIWTPRPLIRSIYWRPEPEPPREAVAGSYEVFLDQRAFVAMHQHVWGAAADESPFGYLVGDLCEDPSASRRFIIVTQVVPSRFPFRELDSEQIGREAAVALQLEVERKRGVLVGWYHAHESGDPCLSEADVATHDRLFPDPWQIAVLFIADARSPAGATFRRTGDGMDGSLQMPFYEMVTNESLLAKGVRRSRVDWENVSTLDKLRSEPPPRPEAPPEPPEPASPPEPLQPPELTFPADLPPSPPEPTPPADPPPSPSEPASTREPPSPPPGPDRADGPEGELPSADFDTESPDESPDSATEELDLEALIAEVESAGLEEEPEPESRVIEPLVADPQDAKSDPATELGSAAPGGSGSGFEDVLEALSAVEEDLSAGETAVSAPAPDLSPQPDEEVPVEEQKIADAPELPVQPATPVDEKLSSPIAVPPSVRDEGRSVSGEATAEERPVPVEPATPPADTRSRRWLLPVLGLVVGISLILLFMLTRGSGEGGGSPPAEPASTASEPAVEQPVAINDEVEGAAADQGGRTEARLESAIPVEDRGGADVQPPVEADPVSIDSLRQMSDAVIESISSFYGRIGAFDSGEIGCEELQSTFVEVMDSWIDYSSSGKAGWEGRLPADLAERDDRLYRGVQDVERLFEDSSCPRP